MHFFDARANHKPGTRGVHALLVGVSDYPFLENPPASVTTYGLRPLSASALSAFRVYEWLKAESDDGRLAAPLLTCRLLLAPSVGELPYVNQPPLGANQAEREQKAAEFTKKFVKSLTDWRTDARGHYDGITLFYFAGHGVQRKDVNDHLLLLPGFGEPEMPRFTHAVEAFSLVTGMAACDRFEQTARNQMFFFDACRTPLPSADWKLLAPPSLDPPTNKDDTPLKEVRNLATLQTTAGLEAHVITKRPPPECRTYLCDAVLSCLGGRAGVENANRPGDDGKPVWEVTVQSLINALTPALETLATCEDAGQLQTVHAKMDNNFLLTTLQKPPSINFELTVLPTGYDEHATVRITSDSDPELEPEEQFKIWEPKGERFVSPAPMVLDAGYYRFRCALGPPVDHLGSFSRPIQITPKEYRSNIYLTCTPRKARP